jgi:hypothetical protein
MTSVYDEMLRGVFAGRAFESPDEDVGVHAAREMFFRAVHRVNPRVVGSLMAESLPLYRPLFEAGLAQVPEQKRHWWRTFDWYPSWGRFKYASERDPVEVRRLRELLPEWADRWRLWVVDPEDDWCLEAAIETLALMSAAGDKAKPDPLYYLGSRMIEIPFSDAERRFEFSHAGWVPTLQGWEVAEARLDASFMRAKKAYKERMQRMSGERGLKAVRGIRDRKGDHFEWLALYQVGRERWVWIAEEETKRLASVGDPTGVTADAIAKAVRGKAKLIGLKLADTDHPGRPPASSN